MLKVRLPITSVFQSQITELAALKGVNYLSFAIKDGRLLLGAIGSEFLKVLDPNIPIDHEDIAIRIPTRVLKPLLSLGYVQISVDTHMRLSNIQDEIEVAQVTIPCEFDFNSDIISEVLSQTGSDEQELNGLKDIVALRDLIQFSTAGIQVKDRIAYINAGGFNVYAETQIDSSFIMSNGCLSVISSFITESQSLAMYKVQNYNILRRDNICLGWLRTRSFLPDTYSILQGMKSLDSTTVSFGFAPPLLKSIPIDKKTTYMCTLNLKTCVLSINAGNMGIFRIRIPSEKPIPYTLHIPFEFLRPILVSSVVPVSRLSVVVYPTFTSLCYDNVQITVCGEVLDEQDKN